METVTLPFYTSHKTVQAGIIRELRPVQTAMEGTPVITDLVVTFPAAEVNGPETTIIRVSAEYVGKHKPLVGGYYVKYADGYESWSPADVFEGGYKLTPLAVEAPASEPVTVVFPGGGPVVPPPGVLVEPEPDAPAAETAVLAEPVGNAVPVAATEAAGEAPAETPAE